MTGQTFAQRAAVSSILLRKQDFDHFKAMARSSAILRDKVLVAQGREPLGMPHINDNVKWGTARRTSAKRHCTACGNGLNERRSKTGLCLDCYKTDLRAKRKRCTVCDTALGRNNKSGRCAEHRGPQRAAEPTELVRKMARAVAPMFGVTEADLFGTGRTPALVEARCVVGTALRQRGQSLPLIGRRLGRDHSSIKHLLANFPKYADRNPLVAEALEALA